MPIQFSFFRFKRRVHSILFPVIELLISIYFIYHAIEGKRGLFAYFSLKRSIYNSEKLEKILMEKKQKIETLNKRLSSEHLDLDLLEELNKKNLNMTEKGEIVIFDSKDKRAP